MNEVTEPVCVRIFGSEFNFVSTDGDEYIQKVAIAVDRRMKEIYKLDDRLSTMLVAVLAAVNICDDLFKLQAEIDEVLKQSEDKDREIERLKKQLENRKGKTNES